MLVLTVIEGPDKGRRFTLPDNEPQQIGRSSESLDLSDQTISRRHAELTPDGGRWIIRDLQSSNGTFVNEERLDHELVLTPGDRVRAGDTVMIYGDGHGDPLRGMVRLGGKGEIDVSLEHTVAANEQSLILAVRDPDEAARHQLAVIVEMTRVIGTATDRMSLLERVMDVVFAHFPAGRGFVLLAESPEDANVQPAVVRQREEAGAKTQHAPITVSKTIVRYVLGKQHGVLSSNAMRDHRFSAGDSVQAIGIRSAMCVPIKTPQKLYGVIHIDSQIAQNSFTQDQLTLLTAVGVQTGVALSKLELVEQRVKAERLAAVGQTVAAISHSIKNIVQGMRGGSEVVELGMKKNNLQVVKGGWEIVARNQDRVAELVLNMLSYSKQRKPDLHPEDVNALILELVELTAKQFESQGKTLETQLAEDLPLVPMELSGIHQAVLNLVGNARDAVDENTGRVVVRTGYDALEDVVLIEVEDDGEGMSPTTQRHLFEPFRSSKGYQGTGLGLVVTKKIVEEHGGEIAVKTERGQGTTFVLRLPVEVEQAEDESSGTRFDMMLGELDDEV